MNIRALWCSMGRAAIRHGAQDVLGPLRVPAGSLGDPTQQDSKRTFGVGSLPRPRDVARSVVIAGMRNRLCKQALPVLAILGSLLATPAAAADKPVFLYSQYFNAPGENRYAADGTYSQILESLERDFRVTVSDKFDEATLNGANVMLIANPNDKAHGTNAAPHHIEGQGAIDLYNWVTRGGGLILMGNQENHNLETKDVNAFLRLIGLKWAPVHTDAKRLELPDELPVLGGLTWAYYTGNQVQVTEGHPARARCLVANDPEQPLAGGARDPEGCLLGIAEVGKGRVVLVTDSGWIANWALNNQGVGGVAIKDHDNEEIFLRLAKWVGQIVK